MDNEIVIQLLREISKNVSNSGGGLTSNQEIILQNIELNTQSKEIDKYAIMQTNTLDLLYNYYGFEDKIGAWYILRESKTLGNEEYRYTKGISNFLTNWGNRLTLTYQDYNLVF